MKKRFGRFGRFAVVVAVGLAALAARAGTNTLGSIKATGYVVTAEDDPTVAAWARLGQPQPQTSLAPATNYTDAATNALAAATVKNHGDATITGDDWETVTLTVGGNDNARDPGQIVVSGSITDAGRISIGGGGASTGDLVGGQLTLADTEHSYTNSLTPAEVTIGDLKVRKTVNSLSNSLAAVTATLNGEDAKYVITNYNSATRLPSASLTFKVSDETGGTNYWLEVWNELTRWNAFTGTNFNWSTWSGFDAFSTNITTQLAYKSEREYAYYDGTTGKPATEGYFWVGQPKLAIGSGYTANRYATGSGEVWVLESNGTISEINDATNGVFSISDFEGNRQFEVVKGSAVIAYARPNSMTSTNETDGITHYYVEYLFTNSISASPVAYATTNLHSLATAVAEDDPYCPATCQWTSQSLSGGITRYVLDWYPEGDYPQMFLYAKYGAGTSSKIINYAPVQITTLVIGGIHYTVSAEAVGGKTVLVLTAQ